MVVADIVSQIMGALTSAFTGENGLLVVIPNGIKEAFKALFLDTTTSGGNTSTNLSVFATVMLVFGSISLVIGITKLIWHLVARKVGY